MHLLNTVFDCSKYAAAKTNDYYKKYFIAFDVRSVHVLRIIEGYNDEYDEDPESILLEHDIVDYFPKLIRYFENEVGIKEYDGDDRLFIEYLQNQFEMTDILKHIVDYDEYNGFENWDCRSDYTTVEDMVNEEIIRDDTLSNITI